MFLNGIGESLTDENASGPGNSEQMLTPHQGNRMSETDFIAMIALWF